MYFQYNTSAAPAQHLRSITSTPGSVHIRSSQNELPDGPRLGLRAAAGDPRSNLVAAVAAAPSMRRRSHIPTKRGADHGAVGVARSNLSFKRIGMKTRHRQNLFSRPMCRYMSPEIVARKEYSGYCADLRCAPRGVRARIGGWAEVSRVAVLDFCVFFARNRWVRIHA